MMPGPRTLEVGKLEVHRDGKRLLALDSLTLQEGQMLAVVGPNGAGKSTLMRSLTGEWKSQGSIALWGTPLAAYRRQTLACRMAVMPQQSLLQFDFTVREVIELGRLPHRHETPQVNRGIIDEVIAMLGLGDMSLRRFTTLSGGERQRVQFGRVMAQIWKGRAPGLLLLDEPTSALDLAQQRQVLAISRQFCDQGGAVVAILHDLNLAARFADRMLVLKQGRQTHLGTPEDVLLPETLTRVFGVGAQVERARMDGKPVVIVEGPGGGRDWTGPAAMG